MTTTIGNKDLQRSRLAERKDYANEGAGDAPGAQAVSLVNVMTDDGSARPWRIFLGRLDRHDQHAPLNMGAGDPFQSQAAWIGQQFSYAAGLQLAPAIPPRRSNPVWGLNFPFNAATLTPVPFVEIAWGMNTAFPQRMIAHWPAQGGSIVVTGAYVQVWAGVALYNAGGVPEFSIPVAPSEWPVFQAQITPESSLAPRDAAELSLTQRTTVVPFEEGGTRWGGAVYVPDFARRVRVVLAEQPECEGERVLPTTDFPMVPWEDGDPVSQLVWLDDTGTVIDLAIQGQCVDSPKWHPVPAGATMLGIYTKDGMCGTSCADVAVRITMAPGDPFDPPITVTRDGCSILAHVRGVAGEEPAVSYPSAQLLIDALVAAGVGAAGTGDLASPLKGPQPGDPPWEYAGATTCEDGTLVAIDVLTAMPPTPESTGAPDPIEVESGPLLTFTIGGAEWEGCEGEPAKTYIGLVHWRIAP